MCWIFLLAYFYIAEKKAKYRRAQLTIMQKSYPRFGWNKISRAMILRRISWYLERCLMCEKNNFFKKFVVTGEDYKLHCEENLEAHELCVWLFIHEPDCRWIACVTDRQNRRYSRTIPGFRDASGCNAGYGSQVGKNHRSVNPVTLGSGRDGPSQLLSILSQVVDRIISRTIIMRTDFSMLRSQSEQQ